MQVEREIDVFERIAILEKRLRIFEDIEEIKKLKRIYCTYVDGGWEGHGPSHSGPVEKLFVEDAIWDGSPTLPIVKGRKAIADYVSSHKEALPFAFHSTMNPIITVNGDEADGHWHAIVAHRHVSGEARIKFGTYIEKYVRTPEGWRFKSFRGHVGRTWIQPGGWADETTREQWIWDKVEGQLRREDPVT